MEPQEPPEASVDDEIEVAWTEHIVSPAEAAARAREEIAAFFANYGSEHAGSLAQAETLLNRSPFFTPESLRQYREFKGLQ